MDNTEIEYMGYRTKNFSQFPEIKVTFQKTLMMQPNFLQRSKEAEAMDDVNFKPDSIKHQQKFRHFIE